MNKGGGVKRGKLKPRGYRGGKGECSGILSRKDKKVPYELCLLRIRTSSKLMRSYNDLVLWVQKMPQYQTHTFQIFSFLFYFFVVVFVVMEMEPKAFKALYKYSALYQPNISTASLKTTGANPSAPAPSGQHIVYG